jgi:hypothetical protein
VAHDEPAPIKSPSTREDDANRFRVEAMLLDENARGEPLNSIVLEDRHRGLQNDRTGVNVRRHQMDRRSAQPDAMLQRLFLRVDTGERGKQRRMNVEDPVWKSVQEAGTHQAHEAGEADEIDSTFAQEIDERPIVTVALPILGWIEMDRFDPCFARTPQSGRIGAIRHHNADRRVKLSLSNRVDDGLKVAAST